MEECGRAVEEVLNYFKVKVQRQQFKTNPTTTIQSCFISTAACCRYTIANFGLQNKSR